MSIIRIDSIGAGVQSTVLSLRGARGEIPRASRAVFADTGWEPDSVYDHLGWLSLELRKYGVEVDVVQERDGLREDWRKVIEAARYGPGNTARLMPIFFRKTDGSKAMWGRQCTTTFKVRPIQRHVLRSVIGVPLRAPKPDAPMVEVRIGISLDEATRAKPSQVPYIRNTWPLLGVPVKDYAGAEMSRADCMRWFEKNYPGRQLPRSACVVCPFHSDREWLRLRDEEPRSFAEAVEFDRALRDVSWEFGGKTGEKSGTPFLHASLRPLDQVDFDERAGLPLFQNECEGMCGV